MEISKTFGNFVKQKRRERGLTLREFCRVNEFDPGNFSKIERGLIAPPQSKEKRLQYAKALGIDEGTEGWRQFCDLASTSVGKIPRDIASDEELMNALPVLFRSVRGKDLTEEDLEKLIRTMHRELR